MRLSRLVHAVCGGPRDRSRASRCDRGTVEGGRAHFMGTRSDVATGTHVGSGGGDAEQQIRHSWQAASLPSAGSLPPSASCVHSASVIAPSGSAPMATAGNIASGDRTSCRISALAMIQPIICRHGNVRGFANLLLASPVAYHPRTRVGKRCVRGVCDDAAQCCQPATWLHTRCFAALRPQPCSTGDRREHPGELCGNECRHTGRRDPREGVGERPRDRHGRIGKRC